MNKKDYNFRLKNDLMYSWSIEKLSLNHVDNDKFCKRIEWIKQYLFDSEQTNHGTYADILLLHRLLMVESLGEWSGRLRKTDVTVGNNVKIKWEELPKAYDEFARLIHRMDKSYESIGLLHAEFENIHPFIDGNGRIGRVLIPLLSEFYDLEPIFMSEYFYENLNDYYDGLSGYDFGNKDNWLQFFMKGVNIERTND